MEIEISSRWTMILPLLVLTILIGLGVLGRQYTPEGDKLLSWDEWSLMRARQAYQDELGQLQVKANLLLDLMGKNPDPVRGQMIADQISHEMDNGGVGALQPQRDALVGAATAVRNWSLNLGDRDTAKAAVTELVSRLQQATGPEEAIPTPENDQ